MTQIYDIADQVASVELLCFVSAGSVCYQARTAAGMHVPSSLAVLTLCVLRQEGGHDSDIQAANVRVRQCDATIKSAKRLMEEAEEDAIKASQVLHTSA